MSAQQVCEENVENQYDKFQDFGNQVYQEYEDLYRLLCSKLIAAHLDPFAKILLEHENIVLSNKDNLMETIRNNLERQMITALRKLWEANTVSESLISLEMLKEKFKPYEGHKWNLEMKTPWELTRPVRMRFKEIRLRYLQLQLNFQNKQLSEVLLETERLRQSLRDVKLQRNSLMKNIEDSRKQIKLGKAQILELQTKMLSNSDENITEKK